LVLKPTLPPRRTDPLFIWECKTDVRRTKMQLKNKFLFIAIALGLKN